MWIPGITLSDKEFVYLSLFLKIPFCLKKTLLQKGSSSPQKKPPNTLVTTPTYDLHTTQFSWKFILIWEGVYTWMFQEVRING